MCVISISVNIIYSLLLFIYWHRNKSYLGSPWSPNQMYYTCNGNKLVNRYLLCSIPTLCVWWVHPASILLSTFVFRAPSTVAGRGVLDLSGPLQECWLFWLWCYYLVDRFSFTILQASFHLLGQAEALKASCWDSADRRLLWGADIIRAESIYRLLFGFSKGKSKIKKESGIERGRVEGVFKRCKVKIVAQLPWQRCALGSQSPWLLTLPRLPRPLLETISLPISYCRFHIHHSPPSLFPFSSCSAR